MTDILSAKQIIERIGSEASESARRTFGYSVGELYRDARRKVFLDLAEQVKDPEAFKQVFIALMLEAFSDTKGF